MINETITFVGLIAGWCGVYMGVRGIIGELAAKRGILIPHFEMVLVASIVTHVITNITFLSVILIMQ
jgi:hypothetical protein